MLAAGMHDKAAGFAATGAQVYQPAQQRTLRTELNRTERNGTL